MTLRRLLLSVLLACALLQPGTARAVAIGNYEVDSSNGVYPDAYSFATSRGVFYIAQTCFREASQYESNVAEPQYPRDEDLINEVGPGYIFAAASAGRLGWNTKTRDYLDLHMSDTRTGGWLKFGAHVARYDGYPDWAGPGIPTGYGASMKEVAGGLCLETYPSFKRYNRPDFGAGVSASSASVPYNSGSDAYFSVTVWLHDGLADVFRVTYDYRITEDTIYVTTGVANLCPNGTGCNGSQLFVKEPKFIVGDYRNDHPYAVMEGVSINTNGGFWVSCSAYNATDPTRETVQCLDSYRRQVWIKENDSGDVSVACQWGCTHVEARAVDAVSGALTYWAWGQGGLDLWAARTLGVTPSLPLERRDPATGCQSAHRSWELGRWANTPTWHEQHGPFPSWTATQVGFHGWTGGAGVPDCQNLYKDPGPVATYRNHFQISMPY